MNSDVFLLKKNFKIYTLETNLNSKNSLKKLYCAFQEYLKIFQNCDRDDILLF